MRTKDEQKEQRIKDAVVTLILEEGFAGTSISKIARKANVSPATVYIYYENKDAMMQQIYLEYADDLYHTVTRNIQITMTGAQIIEHMIRSYYQYVIENQEIYYFIEQFTGCPSMVGQCSDHKGLCQIYALTEKMKQLHLIKDYSVENISAIILYPVKAIASDHTASAAQKEKRLNELIRIIQSALL